MSSPLDNEKNILMLYNAKVQRQSQNKDASKYLDVCVYVCGGMCVLQLYTCVFVLSTCAESFHFPVNVLSSENLLNRGAQA